MSWTKRPSYYDSKKDYDNADALEKELEDALIEIRTYPQRWKFVKPFIQSFGPTRDYKYRIVYFNGPAEIYILAVFYAGMNDHDYWKYRIE